MATRAKATSEQQVVQPGVLAYYANRQRHLDLYALYVQCWHDWQIIFRYVNGYVARRCEQCGIEEAVKESEVA